MVRTMNSHALPTFKIGGFRLRRIRPGLVYDTPGHDRALGPFAAVDHAWLNPGTVIPMHEHRNDEILSYIHSGVMIHDDSAGQHVNLSRHRLMMMNAGSSFYHQETAPGAPVEMLQIFVRPEAPNLEPKVQFHDRPIGFDSGAWNLLAGPQGSGAPLTVRNQVHILDAHSKSGSTLVTPAANGLTQWVYVLAGEVEVDGKRIGRGEAFANPKGPLFQVRVVTDAVLVAFLVDVTAPATLSGSQSGYRLRGVLAP